MVRINRMNRAMLIVNLTLIVIAGCESSDPRLAEYAQHATQQQAIQNERMAQQAQSVARQSQELTSAAHDLVEQDAAARRELIQAQGKLQQQLHQERAGLDQERKQVAADSKAAAKAAIREPVVAQAIITAGLVLAAFLPLIVTAYALRKLPEHRSDDQVLAGTLLDDLTSQHPSLLATDPRSPHLPHSQAPRLGGLADPASAAQ